MMHPYIVVVVIKGVGGLQRVPRQFNVVRTTVVLIHTKTLMRDECRC